MDHHKPGWGVRIPDLAAICICPSPRIKRRATLYLNDRLKSIYVRGSLAIRFMAFNQCIGAVE